LPWCWRFWRWSRSGSSSHPALASGNADRAGAYLKELVKRDATSENVVAVHYVSTETGTIEASSNENFVGTSPAEQAQEEAERESEVMQEMNEHSERKASEYRQVLGDAADGDLTGRVDPQSKNDSMQSVGEGINSTLEALEEVIADMQAFADNVRSASGDLDENADRVDDASRQVRSSIGEIFDGASTQSERIQSQADETVETMESTSERVAAGTDTVEDAIDALERIIEYTEEVADAARTLRERADELGMLLDGFEVAASTTMGGRTTEPATVDSGLLHHYDVTKISASDGHSVGTFPDICTDGGTVVGFFDISHPQPWDNLQRDVRLSAPARGELAGDGYRGWRARPLTVRPEFFSTGVSSGSGSALGASKPVRSIETRVRVDGFSRLESPEQRMRQSRAGQSSIVRQGKRGVAGTCCR